MTRGLHFKSRRQELSNGVTIIVSQVIGAIDGTTVRDFEEKLIFFLNQGVRHLVLNFSEVTYINSTGMGILVKLSDRFHNHEGDIKLVGVPEKVIALFDMLGLVTLFKIHDTENSAIGELVTAVRKESFSNKEVSQKCHKSSQQQFSGAMGVEAISFDIEKPIAQKVTFPHTADCSVCCKKLTFSSKGHYKCHGCSSYLSIDADGRQTVHAKMNSDVVDITFPCNNYHRNLAIFAVSGLAQQMGYPNTFWEEIKEVVMSAVNIAVEKSRYGKEKLNLLVVADPREMVIGLKSIHPFLEVNGPKDPRLPAIARKVDKLEVFPLPTGQMLKISKKRLAS